MIMMITLMMIIIILMMMMMVTVMIMLTNMGDCGHLDLEDCAEEEGELGRDLEKIPPRGDGEDGRDLKIFLSKLSTPSTPTLIVDTINSTLTSKAVDLQGETSPFSGIPLCRP